MRKNSGNILLIILVVAGIIAALVGGYFYWSSKPKNSLFPTSTPNNENLTPEEAKKNPPLSSQAENWKIYTNNSFGYKINYPTGWQLIEARKRWDNNVRGTQELLDTENGEIQKVTFLLNKSSEYPATFEISIKAKSPGYGLAQWAGSFEKLDANSPTGKRIRSRNSIILDHNTGIKFSLFQITKNESLVVLESKENMYFLRFDETNPNDTNFTEHSRIYSQILSTFKFLPSTPPDAVSNEPPNIGTYKGVEIRP